MSARPPSVAEDASRRARLLRLYEVRVLRRLRALDGTHATLELMETARERQRSVVDEIAASMADTLGAPPATTPDALRARDAWLQRLRHDAEKERYYLDVALEDWREAARADAAARTSWLRERERLERLRTRFDAMSSRARAGLARREDRRTEPLAAPVAGARQVGARS